MSAVATGAGKPQARMKMPLGLRIAMGAPNLTATAEQPWLGPTDSQTECPSSHEDDAPWPVLCIPNVLK